MKSKAKAKHKILLWSIGVCLHQTEVKSPEMAASQCCGNNPSASFKQRYYLKKSATSDLNTFICIDGWEKSERQRQRGSNMSRQSKLIWGCFHRRGLMSFTESIAKQILSVKIQCLRGGIYFHPLKVGFLMMCHIDSDSNVNVMSCIKSRAPCGKGCHSSEAA